MAEALQEFVDSSGVSLRVDREQGVLRGVKLIGLTSRNGRKYKPAALIEAKPLYEGAKVNVNHPKGGPLSPRDYQDRLGVIRDVDFRAGEGLFGDLHFNPKHPLAEQLAWDAQHNPRNVGVSHNVMAQVSQDGDQTLVEAITHVQSVDLVADPAATLGLYEHAQRETTWEALSLESLAEHRPDLLADLKGQLEQSHAECDRLKQRQRVLELLSEHGLSLPARESSAQVPSEISTSRVSEAFYEMLVHVDDSSQLEQLIAERAALVCNGQRESTETAFGRPSSRDQIALQALFEPKDESSADFARSLKVFQA